MTPLGFLPRWTRGDEIRLRQRVARLMVPSKDRPKYPRQTCEPVARELSECSDCTADNHAHAAYRVGPYLICRCRVCPTLVVPS